MKFLNFFTLIFLGSVTAQNVNSDNVSPSSGGAVSGPISSSSDGPAPEDSCEAIQMLLKFDESGCITGLPGIIEAGNLGISTSSCNMKRGNDIYNAVLDSIRAEAVFCFDGCDDNAYDGGEGTAECNRRIKEANICIQQKLEEAESNICHSQ